MNEVTKQTCTTPNKKQTCTDYKAQQPACPSCKVEGGHIIPSLFSFSISLVWCRQRKHGSSGLANDRQKDGGHCGLINQKQKRIGHCDCKTITNMRSCHCSGTLRVVITWLLYMHGAIGYARKANMLQGWISLRRARMSRSIS